MPDDDDKWMGVAGMFCGGLAALIAFIAIYFAAVGSVGWVFGIALGWIPASIGSSIAYLLFRYLWWLFLLLIVIAVANLSG